MQDPRECRAGSRADLPPAAAGEVLDELQRAAEQTPFSLDFSLERLLDRMEERSDAGR